MTSAIARILQTELGVAPTYRHNAKQVAAHEPLELDTALLKWYDVHPVDRPVPPAIRNLARRPLKDGELKASGLGFVVLHRCGESFYFLIVSTWRNENELWETVWYMDGDRMAEFGEFQRPEPNVPTYCVWELVPVWSEQQSWVRFLESNRDELAARRWLEERYEGAA